MPWDLAVPLAAAGSGAAWARVAAARAGRAHAGAGPTALALLGGVAAAGLALVAYDAASWLGLDLRWDAVTGGGAGALLAAAAIGLVEEGAKLAGVLLVLDRAPRAAEALAAVAGVAGGFAAVEAVVTLGADRSTAALARAALAPVAHALLAFPLAAGVVAAGGSGRRRRLALPAALLASAVLHALADAAIAMPGPGRLLFAAALAAPAVALFLGVRRAREMKGSAEGGP